MHIPATCMKKSPATVIHHIHITLSLFKEVFQNTKMVKSVCIIIMDYDNKNSLPPKNWLELVNFCQYMYIYIYI